VLPPTSELLVEGEGGELLGAGAALAGEEAGEAEAGAEGAGAALGALGAASVMLHHPPKVAQTTP
jgi:hypothetical protein